ncbi:MAG: hypothetical protein AUH85_00430 [Chloroflexi bacterium 13_1_40CM_4_68_4]|nr:MAG: hypothetical protein AUH85_00430 [Chloroflexi bacterium 13_1_40CM_4_68_4]
MDLTPGSSSTTVTLNNSSQYWFSATYPTGATDGSIASGTWTANLRITTAKGGNQLELTAWICPAAGSPCTTQVAQRACAAVSTSANIQSFTLLPNPAAAQTLAAPANSNRIALQARECNGNNVTITYNGAIGSNAESNLSTPAVTVPDATLWLLPLAKRAEDGLVIAQHTYDDRQRTVMMLVAAAAILLLILPLVVTFNEAITAAVQAIGGDRVLADWIVPYESRLAAALLMVLGIPVAVGPGTLVLGSGDFPTVLRISWNCVGWQSVILFGLSCVTALQGHARGMKIVVAGFGFAGLLLMNVVRIAVVGAVAWWAGEVPAIVVHDYGTVLFSIAYLLGFWVLAYSTVLRSDPEAG